MKPKPNMPAAKPEQKPGLLPVEPEQGKQKQPQAGSEASTSQGKPSGTVTPEQQELYDIFVSQGIKLAGPAADALKGNASPEAIGGAMFQIVVRLEAEGKKNGLNFDLAVMLHGAIEILGALLKFAGVSLPEEDQKATIGYLVGMYLNDAMKTGKMSKEQVVQLAQQAEQSQAGQAIPAGEAPAGRLPAMSGGAGNGRA